MSRHRAVSRGIGLLIAPLVTWLFPAERVAAAEPVAAEPVAAEPAALVGGDSVCPTPSLVWQQLVPLVPSRVLADRLRVLGGLAPPVQIIDHGTSFRVLAGDRIREYSDEARDCVKRARFAAVFVAVAAGADPASVGAPPGEPAAPQVAIVAPAKPAERPLAERARLELGATAGAAFGGGQPTIAPGLALRIAVGPAGRVIPMAALGFVGPANGDAGGVAIRQWQGTASIGLRSSSRALGPLRAYAELGTVFELLSARPTDLSTARTQVSFAFGARAAVGASLRTDGQLSPFVLIDGAWFPLPPERFALPAGDLGRAAPWNVGVTAGVAWRLL